MHLLSATDLAAVRDGRTLFRDVTFGLTTNDRVGVIGRNGSGKSTLLRIVAGIDEPDEGGVIMANDARVAFLPQNPQPDPSRSAFDIAAGQAGVREHEAEAMLDHLGIDPAVPVGALSGGQRRRVALARTLLPPADLLVLDEPTNHLDVSTIDWLEARLDHHAGGIVLVTHDRYFLERLTTKMLEIEEAERVPGRDAGLVHWHEGSYSDVLAAREEREQRRAKEARRRRNLLRKEIAWLKRDPKARTSKPKFRRQQAQDLMASSLEEEPLQLQLGTGRRRLGSHVLDVEDVHVSFDGDEVLRGVEWHVGPGERVGLVGPNGSGKTTLLNVIAGTLQPDKGEVELGQTVELAMYEQEAQVPPSDVSVIETVREIAPRIPLATGRTLSAERLCERFGMDTRLQHASVARLSGGERRRLALLHTLVRAPNLLILDEPTNDFDLDTLTVLEDHLDGFAGTLIVCSHDRYVLDRLTDQVYGLWDGRLRQHLDWADYREQRIRREERRAAAATGGDATASAEDNRRRQAAVRELRSVEGRLEKLEEARDALHAAIAEAGADHERAARLDAKLTEIEAERERLEERWLDLGSALES